MSVYEDQVAVEGATASYRMFAQAPADNITRVLRLFDTGLMTPRNARLLMLDVAQQAIDEAESFRNQIADLTKEWTALHGWLDSDTVETTGAHKQVAD